MHKSDKKNLVTGATGLVGAHLLLELCTHEMHVRAIKRKQSDISYVKKIFALRGTETEALFNNIEWVEADITDIHALDEALEGINKVYHTAAVVSFNPSDKAYMHNINVRGTANVVNLCLEKKIEKLCHTSSIAAIGRSEKIGEIDEETPWLKQHKKSNYALSKYEAELEVWRGIAEGLNAVIINPSIIIGTGHWHKSSAKLFETMHKGLSFYTTGINGFVDVRDVASVMVKLMESEISAERFIINAENVSYKDLFYAIAKSIHVKPPPWKATPLMSSLAWRGSALKSLLTGKAPMITKETAATAQKKYFFSNKKIRQALHFQFIPIENAIKYTGEIFLKENQKG